jgi:hypothetical protein
MIISQSQRNIENCVVAEFVAMFNRGYQPLALLKEMQPLNLSRLKTNKSLLLKGTAKSTAMQLIYCQRKVEPHKQPIHRDGSDVIKELFVMASTATTSIEQTKSLLPDDRSPSRLDAAVF